MKLKKSNIILLIIALSISVGIAFKSGVGSVIENISDMNPLFLIIAIILVGVIVVLEAIVIYFIAHDGETEFSFKNCLNINLATQFFNGITPFATGGQPMQVWMLTHKGMKSSRATSVAFVNFILYQTSLVLVGVTLYLIQRFFVHINTGAIGFLVVMIGFVLNVSVISVLILSFNSPKFHYFIADKGINLVAKIHIGKFKPIKDKVQTKAKFDGYIEEFNDDFTRIKKDKKKTKYLFLIHIIRLLITYSIPYFLALSMGIEGLNLLETIVATSFVYLIGASMPLPGGSGGAEIYFVQFFSTFMTGQYATSLMLVWRLITYYMLLIVGAAVAAIAFKHERHDNT